MPTKSVTFDFYIFKCPSNQNSLVKALENEINIRQKDKTNNIKLFDYYCKIWDITKNDLGIYKANVEKINVLDEAHIGDLDAARITAGTTPKQGPLFDTAFFYNPKNEIIILQRNRNGLGHKSFISYLMKLTECDDIDLELVIDSNVLGKLNKMHLVKTIEYTIANPTTIKFAKKGNRSLDGDLKLAKELLGTKLKVEIGSPKNGLNLMEAKEKVKTLLGFNDNISKLKMKGNIGEDIETIDLIKNRIIYTKKYQLTKGKKVSVDMVMDTLSEAYKYHELNLNSMFVNKKEI